MNEDLENILFAVAPSLYQNRMDTAMVYGFCFDKGWFNLVLELNLKLESLNKKNKNKGYVYQAKEKFGYLCFYSVNFTEEMENLTKYFERKSGSICEMCGDVKKVKTSGPGWIQTLCNECRKEYK